MSQRKTTTKKNLRHSHEPVWCRYRTQCRAIKGFGNYFPWVEAWKAGVWLSHGSDGLKGDAVLQWVFG